MYQKMKGLAIENENLVKIYVIAITRVSYSATAKVAKTMRPKIEG